MPETHGDLSDLPRGAALTAALAARVENAAITMGRSGPQLAIDYIDRLTPQIGPLAPAAQLVRLAGLLESACARLPAALPGDPDPPTAAELVIVAALAACIHAVVSWEW